jgi:hypothetical protein
MAIRSAGDNYEEGVLVSCAWMKAKHVPECDLAYQKVQIALPSSSVSVRSRPSSVFLDTSRTHYCTFCSHGESDIIDQLRVQHWSWLKIA